jgi:hypothetical protein
MNIQDLHHSVNVLVGLTSQTISTDTTTLGAIIDMQGYNSCEFALISGTITDGAYAVTLLEDDAVGMGSAAAVSSDHQLGNADFALADDDTAKRMGYIGKKRYVRLKIVSSVTTSGGVFAGVCIQGAAKSQPVAD